MAWTERYVRADAAGGGDGTTTAASGGTGAFTLAEAITHSTTNTGVRYNVMAVGGTFANTTTTRTFSGIALTTAPNWWRGCNTAAGDLDADFTTAKPSITFTTGQFSVTGAHQIFSNLNVSGATTAANGLANISSGGAPCWIDRCRFTNTAANSASRALSVNGNTIVTRSYFSATSTATTVVQVGASAQFVGNIVTGGGIGLTVSSGTPALVRNSFRAVGSHGISWASASVGFVDGNTFRGCGGDGINFSTLPTLMLVTNCLPAGGSGWGLNNASGANTNAVKRLGNDFWNNTSGTETGFGDSPSLSQLSESSDPHTSASNLGLVAGASALAGGQPGLFENESYTSYLDCGAVQKQAAGGGGIFTSGIIQGVLKL